MTTYDIDVIKMSNPKLHGDLLFVISHYTKQIVEDLEDHKRDSLEEVVYQSLNSIVDEITPFEIYSRIAESLMKYVEHKNPKIQLRMMELIQHMIQLNPRPERSNIVA